MRKSVFVFAVLLAATSLFADSAYRKAVDRLAKRSSMSRWENQNISFPFEVRVDRTTIPGKAIHWYSDGHSVTVTPHRVDSIRLTNTVDSAVLRTKKHKDDYAKAVRKDKKNVEKAVDELKKLKEKSSESVADLFQDAIDVFEGK